MHRLKSKVQRKTMVMIAAGLALLVVVVCAVSWFTVMRGFAQLERNFLLRNVVRSQEAVAERISNIAVKLVDWAKWDDTYAFISDRNQAYIKSNITPDVLADIKLDMMIFLDVNGKAFYTVGRTPGTDHGIVPPELMLYIFRNSALISSQDEKGALSGIIMLAGRPAMLASHPVLTSQGRGPKNGTVLFLKYLDGDELKHFSDVVRVTLSFQDITAPSLPADFMAAEKAFRQGKATFVAAPSDKVIAGYRLLKDINGIPILIMKVEVPREITLFGRRTLFYFMLALFGVGGIFALVVYWPLKKEIGVRSRLEERLSGLNDIFGQLARHSRTVAWEVDAKGLYTYVSHIAEYVWGYHPSALVGKKHFYDLHPEQGREAFKCEALAAFERREIFKDFVNPLQIKPGKTIWVSTTGFPILNPDGTLKGYRGNDTDITRRKLAEESLLVSKSRLDLALRSAHMGVWQFDLVAQKRVFDEQVCRILGIDPATFHGTADEFFAVVHPDDRPRIKSDLVRTIEYREPYESEYRALWPDGSVHHITSRGELLCNADGNPLMVNGILWDVSDKKKAEEALLKIRAQLVQTDKMATLGEMATGMAHEMNQPLAGIALSVTMFRKLIEKKRLTEEKIAEGVKDIEANIQRMVNTINHVRIYARQELVEFQPVDVPQTIDMALNLMGTQLSVHGVELLKTFAPDLPKVMGEPSQLEQIWINFISNARHSMEQKERQIKEGRITLADYHKSLQISISYELRSDMLKVVFADNGMGINREVAKKAFEPFFTTKTVGEGTGLGLSICHGIVQNHKGRIEITGRELEGATLTVYLPVAKMQV